MIHLKYAGLILLLIFATSSDEFGTEIGGKIDTFNGVHVYFNGKDIANVVGRNVTDDGYNLGLKYQCVEFVKRYYLQALGHKMPHAFGHAKDFFDKSLPDSAFNTKRGLMQYRNAREYQPQVNDLLVYDSDGSNRFGHVAIVSAVTDDDVELVQQNMGLKTRIRLPLVHFYHYWTVADYHILGWLRKE
ncbi:MAG: CHAP domain-containing protein [Saprospiraceae bacterium]